MAHFVPAEDLLCLESEDALTAGTIGFMPRLLVLTTLPHRRPESHRFERVNGRHSLRMIAPGRVGLPYGVYPRLLLAHLTTEAVRTKSPRIQFGADYARPRDFRRKAPGQLSNVLRVYPTVRIQQTDAGLRLYPSPPHVQGRVRRLVRGSALGSSEA